LIKGMGAMEWLNKMVDAINYMEDHMDEKIDIEDVAKVALSSTFHFQRMFHMITGFTVAEYIRNRRLIIAGQKLGIKSNIRGIDVAQEYGYESAESFSTAFRSALGIMPSAAREFEGNLNSFPRNSFQLSLKGDRD